MREKLLGNLSEGLVFVVSAPAGTGKTTLVTMLCAEFNCVVCSISSTTRPPREGEIDGREYHFLSKEAFKEKIADGDFLEHAKVFNHEYGTSKEQVEKQRKRGKHVILVIDTQGAMQLKKRHYPAIYVFVRPPSIQELRERLLKRKTESEEIIEQRLSWAEKEMSMAGQYDYQIINDHLQSAYQILKSIVIAEEHRVR